MNAPVYPPPEKLNYRERIRHDFKTLGLDFRINDLDDSPWCKVNGHWEMLSKPLRAEIRMRLRRIGYSRRKSRKPSLTTAEDEWLALAHQQRYNPVKDYFEQLRQKPYYTREIGMGFYEPYLIPQIQQYLTNPDGHASTWLFRWMVGCLAKLYKQERNPMLVFAGPQYIGKSSFIRWLCPLPDFFREGAIRPEVKDERIRLADTFIQEVPELGNSTRKADVEAMKDHLTRKSIVERLPYGELPVKKYSICNFFGSVNFDGAGFLIDPTGNTRFLCCEVTAFNFDYSQICPESLWREALWFFDHGHRAWELTPSEREMQRKLNAEYQLVDALEDVIETHLEISHDPKDWMSTYDIRELVKPYYRTSNDRRLNMELAKILSAKGLKRRRGSYSDDEPHRKGWEGIKRVKSTVLE